MLLTNQLVKYVVSLHLHKYRQKYNKFIAEGPKVCEEFLICDIYPIEYIFCTQSWLDDYAEGLSENHSQRTVIVKPVELKKISCIKSPNNILIVLDNKAKNNQLKLSQWKIYLDTVQDPGNLGAIMRIADWYGIIDVIASPGTASFYNPKVVQSAMGAHNRLKLQMMSYEEIVEISDTIISMSLDGESIDDCMLESGTIIMGNESKGVSEIMQSSSTQLVKIGGQGGAESLNVAVACGIACHVICHQKRV